MLSSRAATRALGHSARPRLVPGTSSLYTREGVSQTILRLALAPGVSSRRNISFSGVVESIGDAFVSIHSVTGLPWYLLVPALGIAQAALFNIPLRIKENNKVLRTGEVVPILSAWSVRIASQKVDHPTYTRLLGKERTRLLSELKLEPWRDTVARLAIYLPSFILPISAVRHLALNDPSFSTEGCLWFSNLSAADHTGILPVLVGAGLIYRVVPKSLGEARLLFDITFNEPGLRAKRMGMTFGVVMMFLLINAPAATSLFWLSSIGSSVLSNRIVDKYIPRRKFIDYNRIHTKGQWHTLGHKWYVDGPK